MATSFYILVSERRGQQPLFNGLLATIAGIICLIWPEWLYMMVGIYFIIMALLSLYFKGNTLLTATAAIAGIFIFIYPALIPVTFAIFLIIFGLISIMTSFFVWVGVVALIMAGILFLYPGSIGYLAGIFLLLFGLKHLFDLVQEARGNEELRDES